MTMDKHNLPRSRLNSSVTSLEELGSNLDIPEDPV